MWVEQRLSVPQRICGMFYGGHNVGVINMLFHFNLNFPKIWLSHLLRPVAEIDKYTLCFATCSRQSDSREIWNDIKQSTSRISYARKKTDRSLPLPSTECVSKSHLLRARIASVCAMRFNNIIIIIIWEVNKSKKTVKSANKYLASINSHYYHRRWAEIRRPPFVFFIIFSWLRQTTNAVSAIRKDVLISIWPFCISQIRYAAANSQ